MNLGNKWLDLLKPLHGAEDKGGASVFTWHYMIVWQLQLNPGPAIGWANSKPSFWVLLCDIESDIG